MMMNPTAFFNKIRQTISKIKAPYEYGDFDADSFRFIFGKVKDILDKEDSYFKFKMEKGCTKGVLIPLNGDFVFKIPFDFDINTWTNLSLDYCSEEVDHFHEAKNAGLDYVFVKTKFFNELENQFGTKLPIYIQDKVTPFTGGDSSDDRAYREISGRYSNTDRLAPAWVEYFCNYYGMEAFDDLGTFVDKVGINDLHSNNIGYYHDEPVIFDYSGFYDGTSNSSYWNTECDY